MKYIIFSMEVKRFLQNRKQIRNTFLVPVLVVLALFLGLTFLEMGVQGGSIEVYGVNLSMNVFSENFSEYELVVSEESFSEEISRLGTDKNIVVINALQDEIQVLYDSSMITNTNILEVGRCVADGILAMRINEKIAADYWEKIDKIQLVDIGQPEEYIKNILLPLLSMVLMIILMLSNMSVSSLAIETIAGDREKGSFDLLLLSGADLKTIVFEKYIFVMLNAFLMMFTQGIALFLGLCLFQPQLYSIINLAGNGTLSCFVPLTGCFMMIAMFTSALFIAMASSAEKKKQASANAGIIQIVMAVFTYIPTMAGEEMLNYLPISNLTGVLEAAIAGESTIDYLTGCFGISFLVTVISLGYARSVLERDRKK